MMYKCQRINNPFIVKEPQKKKTSEKKHCIKDVAEKKGNEMERKGGGKKKLRRHAYSVM